MLKLRTIWRNLAITSILLAMAGFITACNGSVDSSTSSSIQPTASSSSQPGESVAISIQPNDGNMILLDDADYSTLITSLLQALQPYGATQQSITGIGVEGQLNQTAQLDSLSSFVQNAATVFDFSQDVLDNVNDLDTFSELGTTGDIGSTVADHYSSQNVTPFDVSADGVTEAIYDASYGEDSLLSDELQNVYVGDNAEHYYPLTAVVGSGQELVITVDNLNLAQGTKGSPPWMIDLNQISSSSDAVGLGWVVGDELPYNPGDCGTGVNTVLGACATQGMLSQDDSLQGVVIKNGVQDTSYNVCLTSCSASGTLGPSSQEPPTTASEPVPAPSGWNDITASAGSGPPERGNAAMAYDEADGYTLLFGGRDNANDVLGDTWTLKDGHWSELNPQPSPRPRAYASMVYDAADGYVLMFGGGSDNSDTTFGDTWAFKAGTWTELSPPVSPPAREYAAMAYDPAMKEVLLFGGTDSSQQTYFDDTWAFHAGRWTQLDPSSSPTSRAGASMVYDAADNEIVLFGGTSNFYSSGAGLDDTWTFSNNSWQELTPSNSPSSRDDYSLQYDSATGQVVFYGGWNPAGGCGETLGDTWEFSDGSWQSISTPSAPSPRQGASMAYDDTSEGLILFGGTYRGCGVTPESYADTWEMGSS
jgi:Galactose oxidase, central domain